MPQRHLVNHMEALEEIFINDFNNVCPEISAIQCATYAVRDILIPTVEAIDVLPERELFQSFGLAAPESGGAISKGNVITTQALTTAEFRVRLNAIQFEKEELILREQIEVEIKYEKPIFTISTEILKIRTNAYDYNTVLRDFQKSFIELYQELIAKPSSELSADELSAKSFMDSVVFAPAN